MSLNDPMLNTDEIPWVTIEEPLPKPGTLVPTVKWKVGKVRMVAVELIKYRKLAQAIEAADIAGRIAETSHSLRTLSTALELLHHDAEVGAKVESISHYLDLANDEVCRG